MDGVSIDLGGRDRSLSPTLGAAMELNKRYGGLMNLLAALERYDLAAAIDVVLCGLNLPEAQRQRATEDVYQTGLVSLTPALIRYVIVLANGGRAPKAAEEEAKPEMRPFG